MSKSSQKLNALSLRRLGWSIKDISRKLKVSRSSVSVWCQGINLTEKQKAKLHAKQVIAGNVGRQKGAEMNRNKRLESLAVAELFAKELIKNITNKELFYLGLGLYWGEGIKSRSGPAAIVNSDPEVLKVSIKWFYECFHVDVADIRPYVYISEQHKDREKVIMKY